MKYIFFCKIKVLLRIHYHPLGSIAALGDLVPSTANDFI